LFYFFLFFLFSFFILWQKICGQCPLHFLKKIADYVRSSAYRRAFAAYAAAPRAGDPRCIELALLTRHFK